MTPLRGSGASLLTGRRLGAFEVQERIGVGGMGEVYRAHDTKLGRDVAVKILPSHFTSDPDRLARFEREARVLASLNHPHIGAIYGSEDADGVRALVLELVQGETLADRIARGPIPLNDAVTIARQIVDALDAAHEGGIVHRDLKPAYIKITPEGAVKVLDFGLAKAVSDNAATADLTQSPTVTGDGTRAGVILGTAAYMSPEQARGRFVDKRTDVWAFGCVLFEMLARRRAFRGETLSDTLAAILEREPDWSALRGDTPAPVRSLLRRLLEKDTRYRLRDIADVRFDLEHARDAAGEAPSAPVALHRRWLVITTAAISLLLVGALLGRGLLAPADAPISPIGEVIVSQLTNYDGSETSGAIAPDGRLLAFVSNQGGTADLWVRQVSGGDPVRLTNDAASESSLVFAPDGESIYFTRSDGADTSIWRIGALGGQPRKVLSEARAPAVSRDGRRIAWFAPEPSGFFSLVVSALDGSARRVLAENVHGVVDVTPATWSSDGARIAYVSGGLFEPRNLFIVDIADGSVRQVTRFTRSQEGPSSAAWLPDNRHLIVSYSASKGALGASDLGVLDSATGSITRFTTNVTQGFNSPSLSADGSRMVVTANSPQREVWKIPFGSDALESGRAAVRLVDATLDPMWTFVTRDGKTLLFNNALVGSRNLWTMPTDGSSKPRQITSMAGDAIMHSSLSPDAAQVAFASSATGNSDVWVQNVDGSDLRQLTNDAPAEAWPVWSPDGQWIMFASLREGAWETRRIRPTGGPAEKVVDGFFRGDWVPKSDGSGTWIVTSMEGGGLRLLDGERRTVVWQDRQPGNALPIFSPDGQSVSIAYRESRDRDAIWVYDVTTGTKRVAARFPQQFHISFRANWVDDGRAFIVNRTESTSHVVMFDGFWKPAPRAGR